MKHISSIPIPETLRPFPGFSHTQQNICGKFMAPLHFWLPLRPYPQLCFYEPLTPVPRGEGSFAVMLRRRPGEIFGDGYHGDNGESFGASSWRTRPLPLAARATLVRVPFTCKDTKGDCRFSHPIELKKESYIRLFNSTRASITESGGYWVDST